MVFESPDRADAFARQNERLTREFLRSLTLDKSLKLGEMLIETYHEFILREFEYRRSKPPCVSIAKSIEQAEREQSAP